MCSEKKWKDSPCIVRKRKKSPCVVRKKRRKKSPCVPPSPPGFPLNHCSRHLGRVQTVRHRAADYPGDGEDGDDDNDEDGDDDNGGDDDKNLGRAETTPVRRRTAH